MKPEYIYKPRGSHWVVYKCTYCANGSGHGSKVAEFKTRDEARDEVYRLNGWKLKN